MEPTKNNVVNENSHSVFQKQPITCPWITSQPYPSTLNKNRPSESTLNKKTQPQPVPAEAGRAIEKTCPSLQQSSSQFFYFLRLMQLFPETHPATLHTVLTLCKNDFFCAVDKLLYAKRCKAMYQRNHTMLKKCPFNRSHPYCGFQEPCKGASHTEVVRDNASTQLVTEVTRKLVDGENSRTVILQGAGARQENSAKIIVRSDISKVAMQSRSDENMPSTSGTLLKMTALQPLPKSNPLDSPAAQPRCHDISAAQILEATTSTSK